MSYPWWENPYNLSSPSTTLDELIILRDHTYALKGVTYYNGDHFISKIIIENKAYSYDGLENNGKLNLLHQRQNILTSTETHLGSKYYATVLFYVKNNIQATNY